MRILHDLIVATLCCMAGPLQADDTAQGLSRAIGRCNADEVRQWLERGADANLRLSGEPALDHCISNRTIARLLIEHGADVDAATDEYKAPLIMTVARSGYSDTAELLLKRGAKVNVTDKGGETVLNYVAEGHDRYNMLKLLLANSADPNIADQFGKTALMLAARAGNTANLELLLTNGAAVNATDLEGETALMYAARQGYVGVMQVLLKNHAEIDAVNKVMGRSALMLAVSGNYTKAVSELLAQHADPRIKDKSGNTALSIATIEERHIIADLIRQAGGI